MDISHFPGIITISNIKYVFTSYIKHCYYSHLWHVNILKLKCLMHILKFCVIINTADEFSLKKNNGKDISREIIFTISMKICNLKCGEIKMSTEKF